MRINVEIIVITPPPGDLGRTNLETKVRKIGGRNKRSKKRVVGVIRSKSMGRSN